MEDSGISKRISPKEARSLLYNNSPVHIRLLSSGTVGMTSIEDGWKGSGSGDACTTVVELRRGGRGRVGGCDSGDEKLFLRGRGGETDGGLSQASASTSVSISSI